VDDNSVPFGGALARSRLSVPILKRISAGTLMTSGLTSALRGATDTMSSSEGSDRAACADPVAINVAEMPRNKRAFIEMKPRMVEVSLYYCKNYEQELRQQQAAVSAASEPDRGAMKLRL
jgi:hypothetical protein